MLEAIGVDADRSSTDAHGTREFLIICAVIAVVAAVIFGWVVPCTLGREALGIPALVLSVAGLVSVLVFWMGLPPILAAAGALLGWAGRDSVRGAGKCRGAMVIGALALAAYVTIFILDSTNTI